MKILQVNCVYNKGSTGKITKDILNVLLEKNIDSVVCYGRGKLINNKEIYKICWEGYSKFNQFLSRLTGIMYGGCYISTKKLINVIKRENPDVVHLHCINGYFVNIYKLISWLKENKINTVLTLHAEFMYTANCGYAYDCNGWKIGCGNCKNFKSETKSLFLDNTKKSWELMKKAFSGFDENIHIISVSPWLMNRAKQSPILCDKKHKVIYNGIDTNIFHVYDNLNLKTQHGIKNEKILFHATPNFNNDIDHVKGGYYILKLAQRLINSNIKIFVAGNYDTSLEIPKNVILLGKITNQEKLAQYYSMADVTILTSRRETYSMVTVESLCCGTPVVGFKAGGPECIAIKEYTSFVEHGNMEQLTRQVRYFLDKKIDRKKISAESKNIYSKESMVENYIKEYKSF